MPTRLPLAIVASIAFGSGLTAEASPITYDFAGNYYGTSPAGAGQFSGSFTIEGDPTTFRADPGAFVGGGVFQNGSEVSLTVNLGGQAYHFSNGQGPSTTASFAAGLAYSSNAGQSPQDEASILGITMSANGSPGAEFAMSFYSDAATDQLGNLRDFSFPLGSSSVFVTAPAGYVYATLNSIELAPTSTPEPSTLALFAVLGIAAIAHRRRRQA